MRDLLVLDKHVSNRIEPFHLNRKLKPTKQEQARFEWVTCGFDFRFIISLFVRARAPTKHQIEGNKCACRGRLAVKCRPSLWPDSV
jgi:hypothetical protein